MKVDRGNGLEPRLANYGQGPNLAPLPAFFMGELRVVFTFLFLFFKINLFIYLFIFGCIGSSLLCVGFLWLLRAGAALHCGEWASHCGGFSCCGARALGTQASLVVARGLSSCGSRALECRLSSCGSRALERRLSSCGSWALECRLSSCGARA